MFKLGYARKFDNAPLKLHTYFGPGLPPPPESVDWTLAISTDLGMMGNGASPDNPPNAPDGAGDCTCADIGHVIMLQTANEAGIVVLTAKQVLDFYSAVTGYDPADPSTDQGASLTEVAKYAQSTGMAGHKIKAYLDVDFTNMDHVRQSIYLFKNCAFGVRLPKSAMDSFGKGTWSDTTDTHILGGHDVPGVAYDAEGPTIITWGAYQKVTWAWLATYCDEAQARLYEDAVEADFGKDANGFDLAQLEADLAVA